MQWSYADFTVGRHRLAICPRSHITGLNTRGNKQLVESFFNTIRETLASGKEVCYPELAICGWVSIHLFILVITMILWRRLGGNITGCPLTERSGVAALFSP